MAGGNPRLAVGFISAFLGVSNVAAAHDLNSRNVFRKLGAGAGRTNGRTSSATSGSRRPGSIHPARDGTHDGHSSAGNDHNSGASADDDWAADSNYDESSGTGRDNRSSSADKPGNWDHKRTDADDGFAECPGGGSMRELCGRAGTG